MELKIPSTNNLKISCSIHRSKKKKSSSLSILLPGFLDSKDYPHLVELGKELAVNGFTTARFDPLGVWKSEGDINLYSVSQYLKDLENVINYFRNSESIQKFFLIGHSLGGMVSILYAINNQNIIDGVVAIMPPFSQIGPQSFQETLEKWKKDGVKTSFRALSNNSKREKEFKVAYQYIIDSKKYNVLKTINRFKKPLFLISGEFDDKITPQEVKKIYKAANEPKKFIVIKGIGHDYRLDLRKIKKVNKEVLVFLEDFN